MTDEDTIDLAYEAFRKHLDPGFIMTIHFWSDDTGRTLDIFVEGMSDLISAEKAASKLRSHVPPKFEGYRTIIKYRERELEEDEL
jgi:hypothetical protein